MDGSCHSTSFYLQRDASNYYALFFLTNNLLGLERIIDVKWEIDISEGEGFLQKDQQMSLFREEEQNEKFTSKMQQLREIIINEIYQKKNVPNIDLYYITITSNFRATHALSLMKQLQNEELIAVLAVDGTKVRKGAFYLSHKHYSSGKPTLNISLKEK